MDKSEREQREFKSLMCDQRYAKNAWRVLIGEALQGPAKPLPASYDKEGQPTFQTMLDEMAYNNVKARLMKEGLSREPMQAELIVECNVLRARNVDMAWGTLLDRTAGKVKEEVSISDNPYEDLTEEELDVLAAFREQKQAEEAAKRENPSTTSE